MSRHSSGHLSTLFRAGELRTTDSPMSAATVAEHCDAGVYLTNEIFLYRVVRSVASEADEIVDLEDCYSLDVVRVPASDLRAGRLRIVSPQPMEG